MLDKIFSSTAHDSRTLAISLMLVSLVMLSAQDALVKLVSSETSLWQFQILRAVLNLLYLGGLAWLFMRGQTLRPKSSLALLCRSIFHVGALTFFFASAPFISLATMAGGLYTFPMFVVMLSVLVLGEQVGRWRVLAVLGGFTGTVFILNPGSDTFRMATFLPVCAGFCYACFVITTRRYCREENPIVMVIFSNLTIVVVGLIGWGFVALLPFSKVTRDAYPFVMSADWEISTRVLLVIVLCAFLNTTANLFIGKAYQSAESSFLAPIDYSYLVFAGFWGWILWDDLPSIGTTFGMLLIAFAGLLVAWREHIGRR